MFDVIQTCICLFLYTVILRTLDREKYMMKNLESMVRSQTRMSPNLAHLGVRTKIVSFTVEQPATARAPHYDTALAGPITSKCKYQCAAPDVD